VVGDDEEGEVVVYGVAAIVVIQTINKRQTEQKFFRGHDDDITCISIEPTNSSVCRGASGQLGGGKGACIMVWTVGTQRLLYRCGLGFFERQVQAVQFCGSSDGNGGHCKYLIGIGGDNSQTIGIFDLKAVSALDPTNNVKSFEPTSPLLIASCGMAPGVPPTVASVCWRPGDANDGGGCFVTLSVGKNLKFWQLVKGENSSSAWR